MPWVSTIASVGMGAVGGILGGRSRSKMKKRMIQYLENQDYANQAFIADQGVNLHQQQERLDKGFKRARSRTLRKSYAAKSRTVMKERKLMSDAEKRGIDTGLINSSVFQGARKGISAEAAQVLAEIDANVAATQQGLDLAQTEADTGILQARGALGRLDYELDSQSRSNWAMLNTGMPIGQHGGLAGSGGFGMDTEALGMLADAVFGGLGGESKSLFDWLMN